MATAPTGATQAVMRFFPGNDVAFEDIDWTKISWSKSGETAGQASGANSVELERMIKPLISTDISDILAKGTLANPIYLTLMGDSITYGYSASDGKSWAALLATYLSERYLAGVVVQNTGVSGWVSTDAVNDIESAMPANSDIVIAMFGTNNRRGLTELNALYDDYTTFYNRAQSIGAKFIPACCTAETLVNESLGPAGPGKYVTDMSEIHRILSRWAKDHNLELLDMYEELLKYCNYDTDAFDKLFNQTETTNVGGVSYPFHIHPNDDGHYLMYRLFCEKLGIAAPVEQYTAPVGGGGGGAGYVHRIVLYRKGYYYLAFQIYTSTSASFQGDTAEARTALAQHFVDNNFTSYSWRSIPPVTGWYRETENGTAIPICAIYYDTTKNEFVGVREGASTSTFTDAAITLDTDDVAAAPKATIFDNNIQAIGGGGGGAAEEVVSATFPTASGFTNFSGDSIVFKKGRVVTLSIILTVGSGGCNAHALLGTIASEYRPSSVIVLPGIVAYESDASPMACGVNVNSDGTVRYYGDSLAAGRHICINGSYLLPS
ncbi:MAG: SGNH/GDSL hydrolase family protein [Eubacterium sp.]|nr:SGNH/GDSL hydrolase family protein [Eubacterium sp.]